MQSSLSSRMNCHVVVIVSGGSDLEILSSQSTLTHLWIQTLCKSTTHNLCKSQPGHEVISALVSKLEHITFEFLSFALICFHLRSFPGRCSVRMPIGFCTHMLTSVTSSLLLVPACTSIGFDPSTCRIKASQASIIEPSVRFCQVQWVLHNSNWSISKPDTIWANLQSRFYLWETKWVALFKRK